MEEDHYKAMEIEQLEDINFYQELPSNEDNKTMSRIRHIYFKVFRQINRKRSRFFLLNFEVNTSNFYGLPKMHKSTQKQNGI